MRDLFVAGTETSTSTLRWAILCLIHFPNIQTKLRQEIHEMIGEEIFPTIYCEFTLQAARLLFFGAMMDVDDLSNFTTVVDYPPSSEG